MQKIILSLLLPLALFAQGGYQGPGRYEIMSNVSRKVLDLDRNDQRTVIQFESRGTDNQTWDIEDAGGGFVYLRNGMNGYALTQTRSNNSEPVAGQPLNNSNAQRWRLESGNNGSIILVNASGKALDIPNGSTNNGVRINTYDRNNEVNQQWTLRRTNNFNSGNGNNNNRPGGWNNRPGRGNGNGNNRYDDNNNVNNNNTNRLPPKPGFGQGNRDKFYDEQAQMWKINGDGVCFYNDTEYHGDAFCIYSGDERRRLSNDWNNRFSSMRFFGRASRVELFDQPDMRGRTETITRDVVNMRNLNRGNWNNRISSFRVN